MNSYLLFWFIKNVNKKNNFWRKYNYIRPKNKSLIINNIC